jgi:hypothetical protein
VAFWNSVEVKIYQSSNFKEVWHSSVPGLEVEANLTRLGSKIEQQWGIKGHQSPPLASL